jgi:hypothetical protein
MSVERLFADALGNIPKGLSATIADLRHAFFRRAIVSVL